MQAKERIIFSSLKVRMKGKFANKRQDDKVIDDFLAANPASARLSESEPEDLEECQNDAQKKTATSKWGLKKSAYYQPETKVVKKSKNADHDKKDSDEADIDYEIANELKQNFTKNLTKSDYTLGVIYIEICYASLMQKLYTFMLVCFFY